MVCAQVGKESPDMRQNERMKFIREGGDVRTVDLLKGELTVRTGGQLKGKQTPFVCQQTIFIALRQKTPPGREALGDWLRCGLFT